MNEQSIMILVAGASASGKTHLLRRLKECMPALTIISASGVLRKAGRPTSSLTAEQALANQDVLAAELELRGCPCGANILDGHAVIKTVDGMLPVPDAWFDAVGLDGVVHVNTEPRDIIARRRIQGHILTLDQAREEQGAESQVLRRQAARQSIPLLELSPCDLDALMEWLDRFRRRSEGAGLR